MTEHPSSVESGEGPTVRWLVAELAMGPVEDFLLARIAEDEQYAKRIHAERCDTPHVTIPDTMGRPMTPVCDCDWYVARVLAECEAKRRIVEEHRPGSDVCDAHDASFKTVDCDTLLFLALPYADHPDHRQEWKP